MTKIWPPSLLDIKLVVPRQALKTAFKTKIFLWKKKEQRLHIFFLVIKLVSPDFFGFSPPLFTLVEPSKEREQGQKRVKLVKVRCSDLDPSAAAGANFLRCKNIGGQNVQKLTAWSFFFQ